MRRLFLTVVAVVLVASLILTGCAQPAPAPAPAPQAPKQASSPVPTPAAAPAPVAKQTITLKWSHYAAPTDVRYKDLNNYANRVKEVTKGGLELKIYPSEQLVKTNEEFEAVVRGSIDIASLQPDYCVGKLPMLDLYIDPVVYEPGEQTELVYQTKDRLQAYFKTADLQYLWAVELQPTGICNGKKMIKEPADLVGLKLRAPGTVANQVKIWGAAAVSIPNPEVYMALKQGVVDGMLGGYGTMATQRLWEVSDYVTALSQMSGGILFFVVNMKTWNSLPDDYKKAMISVAEETRAFGKKNAQDFVKEFTEQIYTKFKYRYFITTDSPEVNKWWDPIKGLYANKALKEFGKPAQEWWDEIQAIRAGFKAARK